MYMLYSSHWYIHIIHNISAHIIYINFNSIHNMSAHISFCFCWCFFSIIILSSRPFYLWFFCVSVHVCQSVSQVCHAHVSDLVCFSTFSLQILGTMSLSCRYRRAPFLRPVLLQFHQNTCAGRSWKRWPSEEETSVTSLRALTTECRARLFLCRRI